MKVNLLKTSLLIISVVLPNLSFGASHNVGDAKKLSPSTDFRNLLGKERRTDEEWECTLLFKVTMLDNEDSSTREIACETEDGRIIPSDSMPDFVIEEFQKGSIQSSVDTLRVNPRATGSHTQPQMRIVKGGNKKGRMQSAAVGPRKVLALWIQAWDSSTSLPMDNGQPGCMTDEIFGTYGDPNNLKTKYSECSYGEVDFQPFSGTPANIQNGVFAVSIPMNVVGKGVDDFGSIEIAAREALKNAGVNYPSLRESSDLHQIIMCFPAGVLGLIGYAYVGGLVTVLDDNWCNSLSAQMHEVGHNLGLQHSGEGGNEYADLSGMMGASYPYDDTPHQCFNAPKNWELGWYSERRLVLSIYDANLSAKLYGINDYKSSRMSEDGNIMVLIKNIKPFDDVYFVSYNKQTGINSQTGTGGNQVLVHMTQGDPDNGVSATESWLIAKLSSGDSYTDSTIGLSITVKSLSTGDSGYAEVDIEKIPCSGDSIIFVDVTPDLFTAEISWELFNRDSNEMQLSVPENAYNQAGVPIRHAECIPGGCYTFRMKDVYGDGICCSYEPKGGYAVTVDGVVVAEGGKFEYVDETEFCIARNNCQENEEDVYVKNNQEFTCGYLKTLKRVQKVRTCKNKNSEFGEPARDVCPITCEKVEKFVLNDNGAKRTCGWLSRRAQKKATTCETNASAKEKCFIICGGCEGN